MKNQIVVILVLIISPFLSFSQDCSCDTHGSTTGHGYLYLIGNTSTYSDSKLRMVKWQNGNAAIDVWDGKNLYFNYYKGGHVIFGKGDGSSHSIFKNDGKLGIGTTNPTAGLDLLGSMRVGSDSEHVFQITEDASNNIMQLSTSQRFTNLSPRNILFRSYGSSSNSSILFLNSITGNVGIGTTSPSREFHVFGDDEIMILEDDAAYSDSPAPSMNFRVKYNSGGSIADIARVQGLKENSTNGNWDGALAFYSRKNGSFLTEAMRISSIGFVGVGTSSPTRELHVNSGGWTELRLDGGTGSVVEFYNGSTQLSDIFSEASNKNLVFRTNGGYEAMRITSESNIGIGTSTPDEKLTVKGKIHTEEVKVDLNVPGPDYVFEPNYNLPTLESVEEFIKLEKHLPEIPSAEEMKENGVELGNMNMLLLKKIEELTLYVIELKKENESQQKEIEELKVGK